MIAIIISTKDLAGLNIKNNLIKNFNFKETTETFQGSPVYVFNKIKIFTATEDSIDLNNLDESIRADYFIFATKHESQSKRKTLTVHSPGNWNKNELGGLPKKICISNPIFMKIAFHNLKKFNNLDFDVSMEATHHGPYIKNTPCTFIEIGSIEKEWTNPLAGAIIAKTIISSIKQFESKSTYKIAIGIGGGHYPPYYNKINLNSDYAFGHIIPKYALASIDEEMLKHAITRNQPEADLAIIDWKGLGKEKQKIITLLEKLNIEYKRCRKIK